MAVYGDLQQVLRRCSIAQWIGAKFDLPDVNGIQTLDLLVIAAFILQRTVHQLTETKPVAKKKAAAEFSMADAIRTVLGENPKASSKEALEAIKAKHPNAKVNEKSFGVAFYMARKKLGIASTGRGTAKKVVRKKVPTASNGSSLDIGTLQAAVKFLTSAGSADAAIEAIRQVQALQLG